MSISRLMSMYVTVLIVSLLQLPVFGQTCKAHCSFHIGRPEAMDWRVKSFSTTITAATIVQIVNTDLHSTRLSTIYNKIPAGYTVPTNTNEKGTQTVALAYRRTGKLLTTKIAFPTTFNIIPDDYTWYGTLPTTDADHNSICSTADSEIVAMDYWEQASSFTTPTHTYGPDPGGLLFETYYHYASLGPSYDSMLSDQAAFLSCSATAVAPANAQMSARFITATSTSYEAGSSSEGGIESKDSSPTTSDNFPNPSSQSSSRPTAIPTSAGGAKDSSSVQSQSPITQTLTSTSLTTFVTDSPSGRVTMVSTVEFINVVVSTPTSGASVVTNIINGPTATSTTSNGASRHICPLATWSLFSLTAVSLLFLS